MDSSKKRCPFCCLGIFTWTTPTTHTVEACARSPPFPSTLACWSLEWRSRSPQHSVARHLLKTNSLPRWPAPHARPCRGGGGSGAREGREAEAALSSFGSSTGDVCSFNSCCLATNYKAEGGHFLPSDVKSTNM